MPKLSTPALLPTMVRSLTPLSTRAWIRFSGIPHNPKPPAAMVIPSFNTPSRADTASGWTLLIASPFVDGHGVCGLHQHPTGQLHREVTLGDLRTGDRSPDKLCLLPPGRRQLGGAIPEWPEQRQPLHPLAGVPSPLCLRQAGFPG